MATDETYNGYTNYETWDVSLWIDNDQGEQEAWLEEARNILATVGATEFTSAERNQVYQLAEAIKDRYQEEAQELLGQRYSASTFADLLGNALSRVNWYEIAENLIEQAKEAE